MINNKTFSHRPISELFAIVKNDLSKFDDEGLIDDGVLIKVIQYCNDRLGLSIREVRETALHIEDNQCNLPLDFEKLYYVCALEASNTMVSAMRNPFNNNFDQDVIYEAHLDRESLGCVDNYQVVVKRQTDTTVHTYHTWIPLSVDNSVSCHGDCPNRRKPGKYTLSFQDDKIITPFRTGTLYMMYIGMMKNDEGELTFPFHPLITPYYEWMLKERILQNALFNSDATNIGELYKLAQAERAKAYIDAFNITMEREYSDFQKSQRNRELGWYNKYFKFLQ